MDNPSEHGMEHLDRAIEMLGEHFDSVQIFATRHESGEQGGTLKFSRGCGNFFARYGQIHEWIIKQDESARNEVRKE